MAGKESVQLELPRLDKNGQRRGGKRKGAGQKPANGVSAGASHATRPRLRRNEPIHVTLRVVADLGPLRRRHVFDAVRFAMASVFERDDFHVVHMSIQADHLHLLVEADDARSLGNGVRSLASTAARFIDQAITARTGVERTGRVFADRYHATIIRTPTQARNALRYVINNWRKHREDRAPLSRKWLIDPFSSADGFDGWAELADSPTLFKTRASYKGLPTWRARTWLLRTGWKRGGGLISVYEVPSAPG